MNPVPDLRAECRGVEAQVTQMLQLIAGPVADPAGVALIRMQMAQALGEPFAQHVKDWPLGRISREWDRFRAETCALLVDLMARHAGYGTHRRAA
jgi:hypothetical protein